MKKTGIAAGIVGAIGMCVLILDGKAALLGAQAGIDQCMKAVIPALFPFFLLSNLLVGSLWGMPLPFLSPVSRLFGVPQGGESLLVSGFLGGYPVGVQSVARLYSSGQLGKEDASRLISFLGQPGPAFLFGMVVPILDEPGKAWVLWGIVLYSAFLVSLLTPGTNRRIYLGKSQPLSLSDAMSASLSAMGKVCGWVVLFQVILAFLRRWILWYFDDAGIAAIGGFLELSGGCLLLKNVQPESLRFLIACGMLSFGGLCVTMQTVSVLGTLPIMHYLLGKLFQTLFSLLLAGAYIFRLWWMPIVLTGSIFLLRRKKGVAFRNDPLYTKEKPVGG